MQTVVKYMHRESRGWEIRTPERAANSTELKPASRKTKGAWSRRSLEGLQMAQQRIFQARMNGESSGRRWNDKIIEVLYTLLAYLIVSPLAFVLWLIQIAHRTIGANLPTKTPSL